MSDLTANTSPVDEMVDSGAWPGVAETPQAAGRGMPDRPVHPHANQTDVAENNVSARPPAPSTPPTPRPADSATESLPDKAYFWLRQSDRLFVGVLAFALLLLMTVHWARLSGWGMRPVEIERHPSRQYEHQIDINTATWVEWLQLEGIGEVLARRIVAEREKNGPFQSVEDLGRVGGIGPKTLEKLRPWLTVTAESTKPTHGEQRQVAKFRALTLNSQPSTLFW